MIAGGDRQLVSGRLGGTVRPKGDGEITLAAERFRGVDSSGDSPLNFA